MIAVYLAGPDVFLPDPAGRAAALKSVCARHGLRGVSPLDALDGVDPAGRRCPSRCASPGATRPISPPAPG